MKPIWSFFWVKEQRLLKILSDVILDRENPAVGVAVR